MTAYLRDSFSVNSPGTADYANKHTQIFNCPLNPEVLKSKCEHCIELSRQEEAANPQEEK